MIGGLGRKPEDETEGIELYLPAENLSETSIIHAALPKRHEIWKICRALQRNSLTAVMKHGKKLFAKESLIPKELYPILTKVVMGARHE